MEIIKDGTREKIEARERLADEFIEDALKNEYECKCGLIYKPSDVSDIRLSTDVAFTYQIEKSIYTRCPHCKTKNRFIGTYISTKYQSAIKEDDELLRVVYSKLKKMKKSQKLGFKETIKRIFNSEI